ncbi:MAG: hypothetical protein SGI88_13445 [Candidatus Hydrogenedentes bacterium]|nr:hypothetical protein [Candidatus Hydrogenedentota bacterium]
MTGQFKSPGAAPARKPCRKCWRPIDASHAYCPYCGQPQQIPDAWYHNPIWILVLAFTVLGPFALPLVWKSRKMNVAAKLGATAAILLYTAFTFYCASRIITFQLDTFRQLDELLR